MLMTGCKSTFTKKKGKHINEVYVFFIQDKMDVDELLSAQVVI